MDGCLETLDGNQLSEEEMAITHTSVRKSKRHLWFWDIVDIFNLLCVCVCQNLIVSDWFLVNF